MFDSNITVSNSDGKIIPFNSTENRKNIFDYNNKHSYKGFEINNTFFKTNDDLMRSLNLLSEIALLEDGWDGYNGSAISNGVIEKSKIIVKELIVQPIIFPTSRDSIQMQYETDDNSYLEFEIFENKILCLEVPQRIYERAKFDTYQFSDQFIEQINEKIKEFYAGKHISGRNTISCSQAFKAKLA